MVVVGLSFLTETNKASNIEQRKLRQPEFVAGLKNARESSKRMGFFVLSLSLDPLTKFLTA